MMKLQSPCLCKVTFLLLCRATSGNPILVNSERRSSVSGAVYSTNSKPSVPIGFSRPRAVFSATLVAISSLLWRPTALGAAAFQGRGDCGNQFAGHKEGLSLLEKEKMNGCAPRLDVRGK